jgi:hypothetical protein
MTPEDRLADVKFRYESFIDRILTQGPPTRPWTNGDASALFTDGEHIAAEYVDALISSARLATSEATASEYKRRAASLPANFEFFAETVLAHWRRLEDRRPKSPSKPTDSLGDRLVEKGLITSQQLQQAREVRKKSGGDLATIIRNLGFVDEREIANVRAASLGLQFIDLTRTPIELEAMKKVPDAICRRHTVIPVRLDSRSMPHKLMIAVGDIQGSLAAIDQVRLVSRCQITPVLAVPQDIRDAIDRTYGSG